MDTKHDPNIPSYPDGDRNTLYMDGVEFQDFVASIFCRELGLAITQYSSRKYQMLKGESHQGIEIKYDRRMTETGNISFEIAEKSRADVDVWTPSGIYRSDNTWLYVQGNYNMIYVFGKVILQLLYEKSYKDKARDVKPTLRAFLVPVEKAREIALLAIDPLALKVYR